MYPQILPDIGTVGKNGQDGIYGVVCRSYYSADYVNDHDRSRCYWDYGYREDTSTRLPITPIPPKP